MKGPIRAAGSSKNTTLKQSLLGISYLIYTCILKAKRQAHKQTLTGSKNIKHKIILRSL